MDENNSVKLLMLYRTTDMSAVVYISNTNLKIRAMSMRRKSACCYFSDESSYLDIHIPRFDNTKINKYMLPGIPGIKTRYRICDKSRNMIPDRLFVNNIIPRPDVALLQYFNGVVKRYNHKSVVSNGVLFGSLPVLIGHTLSDIKQYAYSFINENIDIANAFHPLLFAHPFLNMPVGYIRKYIIFFLNMSSNNVRKDGKFLSRIVDCISRVTEIDTVTVNNILERLYILDMSCDCLNDILTENNVTIVDTMPSTAIPLTCFTEYTGQSNQELYVNINIDIPLFVWLIVFANSSNTRIFVNKKNARFDFSLN